MPADTPPLDATARAALREKAEAARDCGCVSFFACVHERALLDDCTPDVILALLAAAQRGEEELQRVAEECGHPHAWASAAEVVRGKLLHYDELLAEHHAASCPRCGHAHAGRCDRWVPTLSGGHVCGCGTASDPRSNGTTTGHEPDVLPQGMTFHAGELGDAYVAGARSGRDHQPTDEQIARACDAYVKHAHLIRLTPTTPKET